MSGLDDVDTEVLLNGYPPEEYLDLSGSSAEHEHAVFSPAELSQLVANLEEVVAILNELELGFLWNFAHIFGTYIQYVYHEYQDSAAALDHETIQTMADIVHAIIVFQNGSDDDLHVQHVIASLRSIHGLLCSPGYTSSVLMRLVGFQQQGATILRKKCFRKWSLAYSRVLLFPAWNRPTERRFFATWQRRLMSCSQLNLQAQIYAEKRKSAHFFSHWIHRVLKSLQSEEAADIAYLAKYVRNWALRFSNLRSKGEALRAENLQRRAFLRMLSKFSEAVENKQRAEVLHEQNERAIGKHLFLRWKFQLSIRQNSFEYKHTRELGLRLNLFLKKKYLDLMKKKHTFMTNLQVFEERSKRRRLEVAFSRMMLMAKLTKLEQTLRFRAQKSFKAKVLAVWYQRLISELKVTHFLRRHLLRNAFQAWKLRALVKQHSLVQNPRRKARILKQWRLKSRFAAYSSRKDAQNVTMITTKWAEKRQKFGSRHLVASEFHDSALKKRVLVKARFKTEVLRNELENVADLNFQRIHFEKLKAAFEEVQTMKKVAPLNFLSVFDMKVALSHWRNVYLRRYESAAEWAILDFQDNFQRKNVLLTFLVFWRLKSRKQQQTKRDLFLNLAFFNRTNILKSEVFLLWMEKANNFAQLQHRSEYFHDTLLKKRSTSLWYQKYTTKSIYLESLADDSINNRDYLTTRNFLQKWSFKHTTRVQRNQQSCNLFLEKWQRAHLRNFWELWRHKYNKEHETSLDDSFQSFSISPLHKKNPISRQDSNLFARSYLQTPVKSIQPPFTPSHNGPSPTKLQETNQKMKSSRMDAMVNRYKNARLSSMQRPRLSPPKISPRSRVSPQLPPPAPKFEENYSVFDDFATSSPYNDEEIIENAKNLHKIKPITVPGEHQLRFSSPRRLREKLMSRDSSPQKTPQVSPTRSRIFD